MEVTNKPVEKPKEDQNEDETPKDSHVRGKHTLDPKVIHHLEMEILKTMAGNNSVDPLFNAGLPDASIATTSTVTSSLFNTSQSFTMESFTVDSITASSMNNGKNELVNNNASLCQCCSRSDNYKGNDSNQENPQVAGSNKSSELLPPQSLEDKGKITLVLDLDETLVHASFLAIPHADFRFMLGIDQNPVGVFVCVRPGVERFLRELGTI